MGTDRPGARGSGTWGSREAAAEWRRGAAARLDALGPATEMMLDLAGVEGGALVLDVGAGAGDSALMAARRARPAGHVLAVHAVATRRRFPSMSEAMRYARGPLPLRELMTQLTASQRDQAWAEIEAALAQFVGPAGYDSPCEVLIGAGMK